jgi:L-gulonolactone oxidase
VSFRPQTYALPKSVDDVCALVRQAAAAKQSVRVIGAGHSFTPLVQTDGVLVSLDALSGIESIDEATREATVYAGTRLYDLGPALARRGYAMENLGDINRQSIAGAVSTGTHGTGVDLGVLSTQVTGFELVTADGERRWVDGQSDPELFAAGRVSLGVLGILTRIRLRLVPLYNLRLTRTVMSLDECLANAPSLIRSARSFEFYWFPYSGRVATKAWNPTSEPGSMSRTARFVNDIVLENMLFGTICAVVGRVPALVPRASRAVVSLSGSGAIVDESHAILSTPRFVRFNEMEYALPAEHAAAAFREFTSALETARLPIFFPVEYRWVKADDIWLSPAYGRDTVTISCHQTRGYEYQTYFSLAERIFRKYGGRPHWGKIHSLRAPALRELYPKWSDFTAQRARLDPDGRFSTPYLDALFGAGRSSEAATEVARSGR